MLEKNRSKASIFLGVAFLMGFIANLFIGGSTARLIMVLTIPLWILGAYHYSVGKGHSGIWGLLGIFPLLILILIFFPDRNKE